MSKSSTASLQTWLVAPIEQEVSAAIEQLQHAPDVQHIAVMPDVHLSQDVCIGVVIATSCLIYPQAVGGDIGCGMLAVALDIEAAALSNPATAGQLLADIGQAVPARRRNRQSAISPPQDVRDLTLSHPSLESMRRREGILEFATLGGGNHFIELQEDDDGRLWMMIHSGSRVLGQTIRNHHLEGARKVDHQLRAFDANSEEGAAYLHDAAFARRFANASRKVMANEVGHVLAKRLSAKICWDTLIVTDHNHVSLERYGGRNLWIHRKGAMPANLGEQGVLPGSMGTVSFHVEGRGHEPSLYSSAHGAGRALSRSEARMRVTERDLQRQMKGVWYDSRLTARLRDEAPSAYKDIRAVLRAQKEMVKVIRTLRPVLIYKGA